MLDTQNATRATVAESALPCRVVLPPEWIDYFERRGPQQSHADDIRRFVRSHFPAKALMELKQTLPGIPRAAERHVVLMKDISRQGAGFLHSIQLFPGERVALLLPTGRRSYQVVRCLRHNDLCFEIGAELVAID